MQMTTFNGIRSAGDSADAPGSLLFAEGMVLLPRGGFMSPPAPARLWDSTRLQDQASALGIQPEVDRTCLILVENEGVSVLVFHDFLTGMALGCHYATHNPTATLTETGVYYTVLWRGLASAVRWSFDPQRGKIIMGNGVDPNLVYDLVPQTCRRAADQIRPLVPAGSVGGSGTGVGADASLTVTGILWQALEPVFDPTVEFPYQRSQGNYVRISVGIDLTATSFVSFLEGKGTASEPFQYRVACPGSTTSAQLYEFCLRDSNAAGIFKPTLLTTQPIVIFSSAILRGGVTQFEERDVFEGPDVEIATTYYKKGVITGDGFETVPSPIVSVRGIGGQRLLVTVNVDAHPMAGTYDAIRIYVGASKTTTIPARWEYQNGQWVMNEAQTSASSAFSDKKYAGLRLALEVPNAPGSYTLAPSMITGRELSIDNRMPPPCTAFVRAYQRTYMTGSPSRPLGVFYTGHATSDQTQPEGVAPQNVIDLPASDPSEHATSVVDYGGQVVALTNRTAFRIGQDGALSAAPLVAGPLNQRCLITWTNRQLLFLGSDFNLYRLEIPNGSSEAQVPRSPPPSCRVPRITFAGSATPRMPIYGHPRLPITAIPSGGFSCGERAGKMLAFIVHMDGDRVDLTGPVSSGVLFSVSTLPDGRVIGQDAAGNLWWHSPFLPTTDQDNLPAGSGVTLRDGSEIPGIAIDGEPIARVKVAGANRYVRRARLVTLRTGWISNQDDSRQTNKTVHFQTWRNSAGLAFITIENEDGKKVRRFLGEIYGKTFHSRNILLAGNAFQLTLQILVGDGKPFACRTLNLNPQSTGKK